MSEKRGRDRDVLADQLRGWTCEHDAHVRAAIGELIGHGVWLRCADFVRVCVHRDGREAWIDWESARRYADSGSGGSASELAVLDLAVGLRENWCRLSIMGEANAWLIAAAVARAVGMDR